MLFVVTDKIMQRESVVRNHEIYACGRLAPIALVQVTAACQPILEFCDLSIVSLPIPPDDVAIFSVPFRPQGREEPNLVAAFADVPGLGDEFYLGEHGVLIDHVKESGQSINVM